ncbi:MAG TPA: hypothetical protein ENJ19_01425 [Gammaproteobacteria bacterium]|nr:hypothetical protein [Gammaproteobacteria bacterium]
MKTCTALFPCCTCLVVTLTCLPPAAAEFTLNFMPDNTGAFIDSDGTRFLYDTVTVTPEVVTDPDTGLNYYHLIVGDPAEGFIQEVYIQNGFGSFQGGSGSAVGGDGGGSGGNGTDPLDISTGVNTANAEGNPQRVLIRQILNDGEVAMEFYKGKFDAKPRISQMLNAPDVTALFEIDMSNSSYSDMSTAGTVTNTMSLPDGSASFDMASDVQNSTVTGGRYTYTAGSGPGGSDGTYTYFDGGFDAKAVRWEDYFDATQGNPWTYNTNRPP